MARKLIDCVGKAVKAGASTRMRLRFLLQRAERFRASDKRAG